MNQAPCHKILCSSRIGHRISCKPWLPPIRLGLGSRVSSRTSSFSSQKNPHSSCLRKPTSFLTKAEPTTPSSTAMEPAAADEEVLVDAPMQFRIYKSGRIERLNQSRLPAGLDEATDVTSKDVVLDAGTGLSVRLFLPKLQEHPNKKLPVLIYVHGGAFIIGSAGDPTYHTYVNSLAAAAGALVVSVDYRLAPEHPLPAAYEDSWAALQWAASAQDEWVAEHGDLGRLFLSGDSAGANIVHDLLVRAAGNGGPRIEGAVLCHPWFGGNQPIDGEPEGGPAASAGLWMYACPSAVGGADDPRFNPLAPGAPALEKLGCARMLVCAGKKDGLYARDRAYYDAVAASGWAGSVEWLESDGEEHVFFLGKPECENAKRLMDRVVAFIAGGHELGRL